jgi:SagB-type dehydrogenase family enzyme
VSDQGGDQETKVQLLISLLAVEIIYLLSSIGPSLTERGFQRHEIQGWSSRNLRCVRIPGCIRCRPDGQKSLERPSIDTAVVFEDYIGLPARPQSLPRVTQEIAEAHADLGRQTTRLLNSTQIALPRSIPELPFSVLCSLCKTQADRHQPLTIDDLATVLMMTAGVRAPEIQGGEKQRWAATAGNLGSVELFIVVRNVSGLAPGIYFYQADDHSLAAFKRRAGALDPDEFIRRITGGQAEDLADVLVLFTGAFHRVVRKYQQFGYRLLQFDAGVAMSQLQMVAQALNMNPRVIARWPDDLVEDQLNLATQHQQLTTAVALSGKQGTQRPAGSSAGQIPLRSDTPPSCKNIQEFSDLSVEQVFEMLFVESRLREEDLCASPFEIPRELRSTRGQQANVKPLPAPHQNGCSVGEVLTARTSVRHYSTKPVGADQLGSMLHHAHEGDLADWPSERSEDQALTFLAIASRVQGVEPGVYAYVPREHTLVVAKPVIAVEKMIDLFVQPEFASAPVIIWIAGNLAASCARHGAFGHRQLLLRAGAAANRLWMAAMAMDLGGCIVAGVVPGAARQQLGLDGYRHASLIAFAAGHGARLSPSVPGLV